MEDCRIMDLCPDLPVLLSDEARAAFGALAPEAGERLVGQLREVAQLAARRAHLFGPRLSVEAAGHVAHCWLAPGTRLLWVRRFARA
ncbi:hypothetical protein FGE12_23030 [Aggregicoccus sp. 17bor-14]|uniref:hypothetical protein n=1 Tax=Myxococcaceae TaxID=31 RepID=UPI00129C5226|nr:MULTISPECIES: hypothetical protein [Myxococcaceae]MBF5045298.1 hypothetical protein [Simulacricoccus sp. 17bor-14]MRI91039.1 hypothetical protein [Aggregicoccus sp. 17bor-14]